MIILLCCCRLAASKEAGGGVVSSLLLSMSKAKGKYVVVFALKVKSKQKRTIIGKVKPRTKE